MAQGAAQAIEDGAALAACLGHYGIDDIPAALARYEALRTIELGKDSPRT